MKLYKVSAHKEDDSASTKWVSSKDAAGTARKELLGQGFRRDEIGTEEIDFKPTKAGLVEMLNKYAY